MNFQPDMRSIFFQSLAGDPNYSAAYEMGKSLFDQNSMVETNGANKGQFTQATQQKYDAALKILEQGIVMERTNEKSYFTEVLQSGKISTGAKALFSKRLSQIYSSESFNYIEFINLINEILLGKERYQSILELEKNRLNELQASMNRLLEDADAGRITDKHQNTLNREQLREILRNEYLEKHQIQKFRQYFENVLPTVDNLMSNFINDCIHEVFQNHELIDLLEEIYNQGSDVIEKRNYLCTQIINKILVLTQKPGVIENIIESAMKKNKTVLNTLESEIIKQMLDGCEALIINNQNNTFGQVAITPKIIKEETNIEKVQVTGEGLANLLLENEKKYKNDPNNIFYNLLQDDNDIHKDIADLRKDLDKLRKLELHPESDKTIIKNLKDTIKRTKTKISNKCKEVIEAETQSLSDEMKLQALKEIKEKLTYRIFDVSGPVYSEIIDAVNTIIKNEGIQAFWSGPKNLKADVTLMYDDNIKIKNEYPTLKQLDQRFQNELSYNADIFFDDFQQHLPKSGESTNLEQGKQAIQYAIKNKVDRLKQSITDQHLNKEKELEALKELAIYLKNSIFVTETMKTFDNYQNDIGFISGSLGPNVQTQINNIASLFEQSSIGMTSKEAQWLEVAIVNCSPEALGRANQGPIEKYLSTLAGFAVFDEGSFEVSLIAKTASQFYLDNSPKILHLYKLNGLYFPGSYILNKIYENLTTSLNNIKSNTINTGDGVKIRATASKNQIDKDIHNTKKRWTTTYEAASSNEYTSVDITFLSGLLNIVDQLLNPSLILP